MVHAPSLNPPFKMPCVEIKPNQCKGCALCLEACKPKVLHMSEQFNPLGYLFAMYNGSGCTGCEACYYACPEPGAITLYKEKKVKVL